MTDVLRFNVGANAKWSGGLEDPIKRLEKGHLACIFIFYLVSTTNNPRESKTATRTDESCSFIARCHPGLPNRCLSSSFRAVRKRSRGQGSIAGRVHRCSSASFVVVSFRMEMLEMEPVSITNIRTVQAGVNPGTSPQVNLVAYNNKKSSGYHEKLREDS